MKMKLYYGLLIFCALGGTLTSAQFFRPQSKRCYNPNNRPGTCVSIYDCQTLVSVLRRFPLQPIDQQFLRASECNNGFGDGPYVCCTGDTGYERGAFDDAPRQSTVLFPTFDNQDFGGRESRGSGGKTIRATVAAPPSVSLPQPPSCGGVTISNKILGGDDADLYEFPWMVRLDYKRRTGNVTPNCAGSLINQRYVVTAAHCVIGEIERRIGTLSGVILGEYDSSKSIDCNQISCAQPSIRVGIEEVIPHELYSEASPNKQHDIALIRLDRDIRFSDSVRPICLPSSVPSEFERPRPGTSFTVAGWGRTLKGPQSAIKQKLNVPLVAQDQCQRRYQGIRINIVDNQLCAGGVFRQDSCEGDSGAPLMRFYNDAWVLEGVVSFGYKCGLDNWPGVYTRVANYDTWIRSKLRS